ncbi:hypothetical protein HPP92_024116 [Vanilla planifolia]|uniref:PORR domain-containing protein n=1 Tax=Vanilla planifolia TaxID=51239 RepID=A0A835PP53_VANPL|nr:hypothetical protein HPP92_024116 [Vanilla planifolia]
MANTSLYKSIRRPFRDRPSHRCLREENRRGVSRAAPSLLGEKTERANVSNLRKPLDCRRSSPAAERHPGIFYLSRKLGVQTVVLREAYGGGRELLRKHPVVTIRRVMPP